MTKIWFTIRTRENKNTEWSKKTTLFHDWIANWVVPKPWLEAICEELSTENCQIDIECEERSFVNRILHAEKCEFCRKTRSTCTHDHEKLRFLRLLLEKSQWMQITKHIIISKVQTCKYRNSQYAIIDLDGEKVLCCYYSIDETKTEQNVRTWNLPTVLIKNHLDFPNCSLWNCCIQSLWKNRCNWNAICNRMPISMRSDFRDIEHIAKIFHHHLSEIFLPCLYL